MCFQHRQFFQELRNPISITISSCCRVRFFFFDNQEKNTEVYYTVGTFLESQVHVRNSETFSKMVHVSLQKPFQEPGYVFTLEP